MIYERYNYNYLKIDLCFLFVKVYSNKEGFFVYCLCCY